DHEAERRVGPNETHIGLYEGERPNAVAKERRRDSEAHNLAVGIVGVQRHRDAAAAAAEVEDPPRLDATREGDPLWKVPALAHLIAVVRGDDAIEAVDRRIAAREQHETSLEQRPCQPLRGLRPLKTPAFAVHPYQGRLGRVVEVVADLFAPRHRFRLAA